MVFIQQVAPVQGSLALSALVGCIPLATMFTFLAVFRVKAHWSALAALTTALGIAVVAFGMPVGQALSAGAEGAAFGLFPIMWTVVNAVWIYTMTVEGGLFDALRRSFAGISRDRRVQAIVVAFLFGAMLEGVAGFGTPVVIATVMLMTLGFGPVRAAGVALVANTVVTPFGVLGTPTLTMSRVTGMPIDEVAAAAARQVPVLALVVPLVLIVLIDGRRGLRETWPVALVVGVAFAGAQFICATFGFVGLSDIVAAIVGLGALMVLLRFWQPRTSTELEAAHADADSVRNTRAQTVRAYAPYLVLLAVVGISQIGPVQRALNAAGGQITWPGLDIAAPDGSTPSVTTFHLNWLSSPGTLVFVAGLAIIPIAGMSAADGFRCYVAALVRLRWAILSVSSVLALAYVMNLSGQTITIGHWMASAGVLFAVLSPVLGWLGVAATGSNTSSNALFGALQVTAAGQAGLNPQVLVAANMSGGTLGTVLSPQNLALVASEGSLAGKEGHLLRKMLPLSLIGLAALAALVFLQSR